MVVSSSTVTEERHSRKLGAIGARSDGTKTSACNRSIGAARGAARSRYRQMKLSGEAPDHAVYQRRQFEAEQRLRPQRGDVPGAVGQNVLG